MPAAVHDPMRRGDVFASRPQFEHLADVHDERVGWCIGGDPLAVAGPHFETGYVTGVQQGDDVRVLVGVNPHCVARRRLGRVVQQGHVGERGGVPACEHVGVDAEPVGVRRHDRSGRPVACSPVLVHHGL